MTDKLPPLNLPDEENSDTAQSMPHRTAPMRPMSQPEPPQTPPSAPRQPPARPAANLPPQAQPPARSTGTHPATQAQPPVRPGTRPLPPASTGHVQRVNPATGQTQPVPTGQMRKTSQTTQIKPKTANYVRVGAKDSSLYLPWWSLALMLIGVLAASFMIVIVVIALGGSALAPTREPVIVIVTAPPTTFDIAAPAGQATLPAGSQILTGENPPSALDLQGPTLPAVVFTPTPLPIAIGRMIMVMGVEGDELNIRDVPGVIGTNVVTRAPEGSVFTVVEGPQQADGFTWWRIQNVQNASQSGWAASNFLRVVIEGQ